MNKFSKAILPAMTVALFASSGSAYAANSSAESPTTATAIISVPHGVAAQAIGSSETPTDSSSINNAPSRRQSPCSEFQKKAIKSIVSRIVKSHRKDQYSMCVARSRLLFISHHECSNEISKANTQLMKFSSRDFHNCVPR